MNWKIDTRTHTHTPPNWMEAASFGVMLVWIHCANLVKWIFWHMPTAMRFGCECKCSQSSCFVGKSGAMEIKWIWNESEIVHWIIDVNRLEALKEKGDRSGAIRSITLSENMIQVIRFKRPTSISIQNLFFSPNWCEYGIFSSIHQTKRLIKLEIDWA